MAARVNGEGQKRECQRTTCGTPPLQRVCACVRVSRRNAIHFVRHGELARQCGRIPKIRKTRETRRSNLGLAHRWRDGGEGVAEHRKVLHGNRLRRLTLPAKCSLLMAGWRAGCMGGRIWRAGLATWRCGHPLTGGRGGPKVWLDKCQRATSPPPNECDHSTTRHSPAPKCPSLASLPLLYPRRVRS